MVNEFQHKGYALLFGAAALVLTFIFWGIMPPFYWLSTAIIYLYIGIQIGKGGASGPWPALFLSLMPLWLVALVLSWGRPAPYLHLSLIAISFLGGAGGMWLAARSSQRADFVLRQLVGPLSAGLLGMLAATLLLFVVSASGMWPWREVPPYAITLPLVLVFCALLFTRLPGRVWWRDTLIIWLVPFLFLVVYRPLLMPAEGHATGTDNLDAWMVGAVVLGIVLSFGLVWGVRCLGRGNGVT